MTLAFAQQTSIPAWLQRPKMAVISKMIGTLFFFNESMVDKLGQMCIKRNLWHLNAFEWEGHKEIQWTIAYSLV